MTFARLCCIIATPDNDATDNNPIIDNEMAISTIENDFLRFKTVFLHINISNIISTNKLVFFLYKKKLF